jgi:hypothetical protein
VKHEGVGIAGRDELAPLLGKVRLVGLLLDSVEEFLLLGVELLLRLIGVQLDFVLLDQRLVVRILEQAQESLGPGQAEFDPIEERRRLLPQLVGVLGIRAVLGLELLEKLLDLAQEALTKLLLGVDDPADHRLELLKFLVDRHDRRAADD